MKKKRFSLYEEFAPPPPQDLSEKLEGVKWTQKAYYFAAKGYFPLTLQMESLYGNARVSVFHVTSSENIQGLAQMQGQPKALSTMSKIPAYTQKTLQGVWGKGVMFSLTGTLLTQGATDLSSSPDQSGIRWIDLWEANESLYKSFTAHLAQNSKLVEMQKRLKQDFSSADGVADTVDESPISLSPTEITQFMKLYMQESKAWIAAHAEDYFKALQTPSAENGSSHYDEIVVHKIQLTGAIADIAQFGPSSRSPKSTPQTKRRTAQLLRELEAAVGPESLVLVDSRSQPEKVQPAIREFIEKHSSSYRRLSKLLKTYITRAL